MIEMEDLQWQKICKFDWSKKFLAFYVQYNSVEGAYFDTDPSGYLGIN